MEETKYKIADFIGRELPPEILEQLKVVGRVKQFLKPTSTSAVSQAEDKPEVPTDPSLSTEREIQDEISKLIDDVKDFEDQVEQLEDLADEHLKDMAIPAANDLVASAIKQLGGEDVITKDILDKALTIMDYVPMLMAPGIDPVLAALTGDGVLVGAPLACKDITPNIGKSLKLKKRTVEAAEVAIVDQGNNIQEQFDKKLQDMLKDFILTLWWKKLWASLVVDMTIINPLRQFANPVDKTIGFFKKKVFKVKNDEWVKKNGQLNKILDRLRKFLLCKVPPTNYKPDQTEYKYDCKQMPKDCPPIPVVDEFPGDNAKKAFEFNDQGGSDNPDVQQPDQSCFDSNDLLKNRDNQPSPEMFGCSPDCIKAAKVILEAVQADAYTPPQSLVDTYRKVL